MTHLVLLGDSIFDNRSYVAGGPAVIDQVQQRIPQDWHAKLLAIDGNTSAQVPQQLRRVPTDSTHLVLSVGGNDAIGCLEQMGTPTANLIGALDVLSKMLSEFEKSYSGLMAELMALNKPLMVCTIYDNVPGLSDPLKVALALFNDIILRNAITFGVPVLDLRMICTEPSDYSEKSPIEPSTHGGYKIVERLIQAILNHNFNTSCCRIYS